MIRPGLHEDVVEELNEACEPHMAVDPEDVAIEKRIEVLIDAHQELMSKAKLEGFGGDQGF